MGEIWEFFLKINNRACTFIRYTRVQYNSTWNTSNYYWLAEWFSKKYKKKLNGVQNIKEGKLPCSSSIY